ncbi:MAG: DUF58 domain-containing protein [bacterium]|nr:DUF58 domain-containing protein [bacterium]
MDIQDLLKRVKEVEIRTRGIVRSTFSGQYHSVFRGRGVTFREVRDYIPGDDIRDIDWNVSARMNHPYVKTFEEDRELTVLLLVDISSSQSFGSVKQFKREVAAEIAAILAFSAIRNNDLVGLGLFTDFIERYLPPKKGRPQAFRVLAELVEFEPKHKTTNIANALQFVNRVFRKRAIVFVLSDFLDSSFENELLQVALRHDVVAIHLVDPFERKLPEIGWVKFLDSETNEEVWLNTNSKKVQQLWSTSFIQEQLKVAEICKKAKVDRIEISTVQDIVPLLTSFFKQREKRF